MNDISVGDVVERAGPLRIVLAGAGKMALQHARAIQAMGDRARIVGVVDPSEEARRDLLPLIPDAFGSDHLARVIQEEGVDVVHVCTPMETHGAVAREALELGCHVYIEKPVTSTMDELLPLLELADRKELKLCGGHQVLYERPYRDLLETLPKLGLPVHVESYFSFHPVRTSSGRGRPLTETEQLLDVLPHPTYLLLDLLERIEPSREVELAGVEVSHSGTIHALVRRGEAVGALVASLEARPVEHWLRVHGTNGSVHADFVRGSVQDLLGPGRSGIDKAWNPFRMAGQLLVRNALALGRRVRARGGSYPGLQEIFGAFYDSIETGTPSPTSEDQLRATVGLCEEVGGRLKPPETADDAAWGHEGLPPEVLVTGGTGLLGREVVRALTGAGLGVRVVSRRLPSLKKRLSGVEYLAADLAAGLPEGALDGVRIVIHCAAETAGGWEDHERNSVRATELLLKEASRAAVEVFVQVSSVAVLDSRGRGPMTDDSPLHPEPRTLGAYAWGKLESERVAARFNEGSELKVKVVRPVPLLDLENFQPPGRLGRRIGNLFVAVGRPREVLVAADVVSTARGVVAAALRAEGTPAVVNLVPASPPTRGELVARLRESSPEVRVMWLPRMVLHPLSWVAVLLQKVLRPRKTAVSVSDAFSAHSFEAGPETRWMMEDRMPSPSLEASRPSLP